MLKLSKKLSALLLMVMLSSTSFASSINETGGINVEQQENTCKGIVKDENGETVIGVSIRVKGTNSGTITDFDGAFSLNNVKKGAIIQISYLGYVSQDVQWDGQALNITLKEDSKTLSEVVVTALGIKRETKSLGYSMQELKGDALLESRESNVLNALSGKVAGLQVLRSSNGVGGSTKIVLRGNNSLTGNNQPLIVIDGVPMDNFTGGVDDPYGNNNGSDMGSGLADINQEDIESMSVLKGASAAALYGTRAGNGVILITTKSGQTREGLGITVNTGISIDNPFIKPKLQNRFSQGANGRYDNTSTLSWGEAISGQTVKDWKGQDVSLRTYDNYNDFFRTGVSYNNNVSFQQSINGVSVFGSVNRSDDNGTTPGTSLARTGFNLRATAFLDKGQKWQFDAKANYINMEAKNRPLLGMNPSNAYNTIYMLPATINMKEFKDNMYTETGQMNWWQDKTKTSQDNPYWAVKNRNNQDKRDRLIGNFKLKYKATDWLNVEVNAGTDYYTTNKTEKINAGSQNAKGGGLYTLGKETFYENNYSFLAVAQKNNLWDRLSGSATFGGNLMFQGRETLNSSSGELVVPNLFELNNGVNLPTINESIVKRRMNSLYGMLNLSWDNYLYFDVTARNDWTSTLAKGNNSFFYPSFNLSLLTDEMLRKYDVTLPEWISMLKVRGSYAQVGNDMDPYQLYNVYKLDKNILGFNTIGAGSVMYDSTVRSELIKSWEAGLDIRFFKGRLGLDATWYKKNATNQLIPIGMNPFTGYAQRMINAGNIQNTGIEFTINGTILDNAQGLTWDASVNISHNKAKILEIAEGVELFDLAKRDLQDLSIYAEAGGEYGAIHGKKYARVDDVSSPHHGKIIVDAEGLPTFTDNREYLGNQSPNAMIGISNNFAYKGFTLGFLVDMRLGGKIFSGTTAIMNTYGKGEATLLNNRENFVMPNTVVSDGANGYIENTKETEVEKYFTRLGSAGGNFGLAEEYTFDATNIRLRNITLGYDFNKKMLAKTPFQRLRISATCNNVWMIHSKLKGIDPESVTATNTNAVGFEANSSPTSRTFVFNLTVGF